MDKISSLDYFAGLAMQVIMEYHLQYASVQSPGNPEKVAESAWKYAHAMVEAKNDGD